MYFVHTQYFDSNIHIFFSEFVYTNVAILQRVYMPSRWQELFLIIAVFQPYMEVFLSI